MTEFIGSGRKGESNISLHGRGSFMAELSTMAQGETGCSVGHILFKMELGSEEEKAAKILLS